MDKVAASTLDAIIAVLRGRGARFVLVLGSRAPGRPAGLRPRRRRLVRATNTPGNTKVTRKSSWKIGLLAATLFSVACTGGSGEDGPDSPEDVSVDLAQDGQPVAAVSFDVVSDAEAYLVTFDGDAGVVRVEPSDCGESRCQVMFDQRTTAGAMSASVTAVSGEVSSAPSEVVDLPEWPDGGGAVGEWPQDEPVELVITREGEDAGPSIDYEQVDPGDDVAERVEARMAELEAEPGVLGVGVDAPAQLDQSGSGSGGPIPAGLATWQELAWTFEALPQSSRGEGVSVAVLDTGVQVDHPALSGADISTINMIDPGEDKPHPHGTAVASLIAGQPNAQVPGIAPGATIRAYDVVSDATFPLIPVPIPQQGLAGVVATAIIEAVDDGADVISLSMSFSLCPLGICPDGALQPAVDYAEQNGVVLVSSAPNDGPGPEYCDHGGDEEGMNADAWPAMMDTVIAVGNANAEGSRALCSPERDYITAMAPGDGLRVADLNGYHVGSGTSYATPLVAGLVATILAEQPELSPNAIRNYINNATDNGRLIPLHLLDQLDLLDTGVTARANGLNVDAVIPDEPWPYLGQAMPLAPDPGGLSAPDLLQGALGPPAHTDPESWRVDDGPLGNESGDDLGTGTGGDSPSEAVPRPECWDGRLRMNIWEQDGSPLLAALYAQENLSLGSDQQVSSGALLGYRVFQSSEIVRMVDGVNIGQTHSDLAEAYVGSQGAPTRRVEFTGEDGDFELVESDYPGDEQATSTLTGPDLGTMSGQADSGAETILERGAGLDGDQCGLDLVDELTEDRLVSAWLGGLTVHTDEGPVDLDFPDVERPDSARPDDDENADTSAGNDAVEVLGDVLGEPDRGPPDTDAMCPEPGMDMVAWGEPGPATNEFFAAFDPETGDLLGYRLFDTERIRTSDGVEIDSSFDEVLAAYSADPITIVDVEWGGQRVEYEVEVQPDDDVAGIQLPGPRLGVADGSVTDGTVYEFASGRECEWYVPRGDPSYLPQNCTLIGHPRLSELCPDE